MSTTPTFRKIAAGSALALAAGGALLISPAEAATSEELNYTCPVLGNPQEFTGTHTVADTAPYGGVVPVTTNVTIPSGLSQFLYGNGYRKVDGTVTNHATATVGAVTVPVQSPADVQKTDINSSGPTTIVAEGGPSLKDFAGATPAGTTITVAMQDRKNGAEEASDMDASLYTYDAEGTQAGPVPINCELADAQNLAVGTVEVVQADSSTAAKLTYAKAKRKMTGKATVSSPNSEVTPDGQVKLTLKKGKQTVGSKTVDLSPKGIAKASWSKIGKGSYKLIAKYLGTGNFNPSKGTTTKKIS